MHMTSIEFLQRLSEILMASKDGITFDADFYFNQITDDESRQVHALVDEAHGVLVATKNTQKDNDE